MKIIMKPISEQSAFVVFCLLLLSGQSVSSPTPYASPVAQTSTLIYSTALVWSTPQAPFPTTLVHGPKTGPDDSSASISGPTGQPATYDTDPNGEPGTDGDGGGDDESPKPAATLTGSALPSTSSSSVANTITITSISFASSETASLASAFSSFRATASPVAADAAVFNMSSPSDEQPQLIDIYDPPTSAGCWATTRPGWVSFDISATRFASNDKGCGQAILDNLHGLSLWVVDWECAEPDSWRDGNLRISFKLLWKLGVAYSDRTSLVSEAIWLASRKQLSVPCLGD